MQSNGEKYPTLKFSLEERPAKTLAWLESEKGSLVNGADYSLNSLKPSKLRSLSILSGRMLRELSQATKAGTLPKCSISFPKQAIICGGKFSTQSISVSRKTESVSLSSVLETEVPQKYFLSQKMVKLLLNRQMEKYRSPLLVEH